LIFGEKEIKRTFEKFKEILRNFKKLLVRKKVLLEVLRNYFFFSRNNFVKEIIS